MSTDDVTDDSDLRRAADDAALEPWALLKAVRDPNGRVVDFVYRDINYVAARQQRLRPEDLIGRSVAESLPELVRSGVLDLYVRCIDTGEPLFLDDLSFYGRTLDGPGRQTRLYEMRGVRVDTEYLSLNWRDVNQRHIANEHVLQAQEMLQASADAMLDPQVLLEAVRDPSGEIVDLAYREVNKATCDYLGLAREDLLGSGVVETMPGIRDTLFPDYLRCLETGEPLVLDDFSYDNEILRDTRRYDLRVTRATPTSLVLTWRDVTDRFQNAERIANSEAMLRASVDSMLNPHVLMEAVRDSDGRLVDFRYRSVNQATCTYLGLTEDELVGHTQLEYSPNLEGSELQRRYAQCLEDGQPVVLDDYSFFNEILDDGRRYDLRATRAGTDLISLTWSDITDRFVVAQRIRQVEERFRRSMGSAAIGMCVIAPDGGFVEVNDALCELFGYDAETLMSKTWQELTAPEFLDADLKNVNDVLEGRLDSYRMFKQYIHADGHRVWGDLAVSCVRDDNGRVENFISQIADVSDRFEAEQRLEASERNYRLIAENSGDVIVHIRDGIIAWISPSVETVLGAPTEYWVGRHIRDSIPDEEEAVLTARTATVLAGTPVQERIQVLSADGAKHWFHMHAKPFYDADGQEDGALSTLRLIDDEVAAEQAVEEARQQQARSDERYRRSMETAAVGIGLLTPDGAFVEVNPALCTILGYDAETLTQKTWQELTPPEYLTVGQEERDALFDGRLDAYRIVKQYIQADGHRIWADVSVSSVRDENGQVQTLAFQIADITATVEANEQNAILTERLAQKSQRMTGELESAANYMTSIMPKGLSGEVSVSSQYLPSRELGGDCFNYSWIDDDHFVVYLIDVSGHGIEPALLSVSVHNMLRSGSFTTKTLLKPAKVLAELNRLFQMEQQGDHYFTIWFGVYEQSTRTLRYASAGSPPALAFNYLAGNTVSIDELSTVAAPVGMFDDTEFTSETYSVPLGCRVLIHSDGASEIDLADHKQLTLPAFTTLTTRLAQSPNWSLDQLIEELQGLGPSESFEDDCSLIQLTFD